MLEFLFSSSTGAEVVSGSSEADSILAFTADLVGCVELAVKVGSPFIILAAWVLSDSLRMFSCCGICSDSVDIMYC